MSAWSGCLSLVHSQKLRNVEPASLHVGVCLAARRRGDAAPRGENSRSQHRFTSQGDSARSYTTGNCREIQATSSCGAELSNLIFGLVHVIVDLGRDHGHALIGHFDDSM